MRWRFIGALVLVCALALGLMAIPAAAVDMETKVWNEWMSSMPVAWDPIFDPVPEGRTYPDIHGDWIVYTEQVVSVGDQNITAYNIKTRNHFSICSAIGVQVWPRVYGDWVVWMDGRNGADFDIYAYNLATGTEKAIATRPGQQLYPDISGTKVAYTDVTAGDIHIYDLATGLDSALPLGAGLQLNATISGSRVAYVQSGEVYVYDLKTGAITRLTNDSVTDSMPDIDGTLVAWVKSSASDDIWTVDLAGGSAAIIPFSTADDETFPRVDDMHVTYVRNQTGDLNIYVFDKLAGFWAQLTSSTADDVFGAIDGPNIAYISNYMMSGGDVSLGRLILPIFSTKASSSTIGYGKTTKIMGTLVENGIPLTNLPIFVDASTDGGHTWTQVASFKTDWNGAFSWTTPALYSNTTYRTRHNGSLGFIYVDRFSALSAPVSVKVKASMGKPIGKKSVSNRKSYTYYGYLKPRYTAGAQVVWIQCYRKSAGKYRLKKTYTTTLANYSSYSKYSKKIKLNTEGKWRIRARFKATPWNAESYSSWKYVTSY